MNAGPTSAVARHHVYERVMPWEIRPFSELYPTLEPSALIEREGRGFLHEAWRAASSERFGAR